MHTYTRHFLSAVVNHVTREIIQAIVFYMGGERMKDVQPPFGTLVGNTYYSWEFDALVDQNWDQAQFKVCFHVLLGMITEQTYNSPICDLGKFSNCKKAFSERNGIFCERLLLGKNLDDKVHSSLRNRNRIAVLKDDTSSICFVQANNVSCVH